jgi:hypothetical protein
MVNYIRIAVTALNLTACVLLIALWVRSYRWHDSLGGPVSATRVVMAWSIRGELYFQSYEHSPYLWQVRRAPLILPGIAHSPFRFGGEFELIANGFGIPHWFVVFATAALAAAPWITALRRFGLRTLLIATTLVAVVLGIVVVTS